MGKRREGREAAVQFLYQFDVNRRPVDELLATFWALRSGPGKPEASAKTRTFTEEIVQGVAAHMEEIDQRIVKYAANYELHRIATVDRNVLRVGIYEMLHCADVPPVVAINEAIEIAKKFGSEESGRFINGILDRVRAELTRSSREPSAPRT
jgi:N utilization substance protein B